MESESIIPKDTKEINTNIYNKTINILYNKKWLIIIGILILSFIIYLYYSDSKLNIPFTIPCIKLNKKTQNQPCDEITEFNEYSDDWDLEEEINNYMNLQDEYISSNSE